jgi:hypothetical protein
MVIDLIGVVPDGSTYDDLRVPSNPRKRARIIQGSSLAFRLTVVTQSGVPVDLAADPSITLHLTIKKTSWDAESRLLLTGSLDSAAGKNAATFAAAPAATKYLAPGLYVYDVWLTYMGVRDCILPASQLHIEPGLRLP